MCTCAEHEAKLKNILTQKILKTTKDFGIEPDGMKSFLQILDEVEVRNRKRVDTWFIKRSDVADAVKLYLTEIDMELAHLEDIAKGEIGNTITEIRGKISKLE